MVGCGVRTAEWLHALNSGHEYLPKWLRDYFYPCVSRYTFLQTVSETS